MNYIEIVIALIIMRCDDYLVNAGLRCSLNKYPSLQKSVLRIKKEDLEAWADVENLIEKGKEENSDIRVKRYTGLIKELGGNTVMRSLLDLLITLFCFPEFGAYLTENFGYSVNIHLACLLEGRIFPGEEEIREYADLIEKICYVDRKASPLQYAELSLDERVMGYILGGDALSPLLAPYTKLFLHQSSDLHEAFVNLDIIDRGSDFFKCGGKILQLSGKGGRRFIVKHIAKKLGADFLFLNIADFFRESGKERFEILKSALIREAFFDGTGICFFGITEDFLKKGYDTNARMRRDLEVLERILFSPIKEAGISLILCADTGKSLLQSTEKGEYLLMELPETTDYEERKKLWSGFASLYSLELDADRFSMRYRLNPSELSVVVHSFLERRPGVEHIGEEEETLFMKLCMQRAENEEGLNVGRIIYPAQRLNDVKIKPAIRSVLNDVIESIRESPVVLDSWGLRKNYPYGRSVSLLLSGPPGTGKTMTANAIAGELGLPLYQVNLANIVDKYIGETEKNLEKAFLFAEKTDAVLFFDEADALFGSRSEVRDAKDRYANTEIAYLLQRIEAFDGIVVMATNIRSNMDPAFLRRIRYVVRYDNPDEALRREIWESCITEGFEHDEIDIDYLASQFDNFTGSVIKTVFLNACAYAAGRGEKPGMPHLIHAIRHELEKTSTVAFSADTLGKYAYLQ